MPVGAEGQVQEGEVDVRRVLQVGVEAVDERRPQTQQEKGRLSHLLILLFYLFFIYHSYTLYPYSSTSLLSALAPTRIIYI